MVIIPLTGKPSWKNPPIITIALIVINCCVYFLLQTDQDERYMQAMDYYFNSGLAQIEIPLYETYLQQQNRTPKAGAYSENMDGETAYLWHQELAYDYSFQQELQARRVVTPEDEHFARWEQLRTQYEEKFSSVILIRYGFRPAYHRPVTFITSMFMHGSVMHLVGNMFFLWIVGCALELGCGRLQYVFGYILSGLGAMCFFWLTYSDSLVPCIGASGAIAGLMGAYSVLYGRTRVSFFLSLGFYFNTYRLPGILLLPAWVGNELAMLFFGGESSTAYMAHVGGLVCGGGLGFLRLCCTGTQDRDAFSEEPEDEITPLFDKAMAHIGRLELPKARLLLMQIIAKDPDNLKAMQQLVTIDKHEPEHNNFHESASRLLHYHVKNPRTPKTAYDLYKEYTAATKQPRLSGELYIGLCRLFIRIDQLDESARIINALLKLKPDIPGLPACLLGLSQAYRQKGRHKQGESCGTVLLSLFPESSEARILRQDL